MYIILIMSISKHVNFFVRVHELRLVHSIKQRLFTIKRLINIELFYSPETLAPIRTAPATSNILAIIHACFNVSTFDPTDVPNEFATSLAPMPKAKTNAKIKPTTTTHTYSESWGSNIMKIVLDGAVVVNKFTRGWIREYQSASSVLSSSH